jgi:hypothetical protein
MAGNVVNNRWWIEQTHARSELRTQCQEWIDKNADKTTRADISAGLLGVLSPGDTQAQ